jgi:hypothetical protein
VVSGVRRQAWSATVRRAGGPRAHLVTSPMIIRSRP